MACCLVLECDSKQLGLRGASSLPRIRNRQVIGSSPIVGSTVSQRLTDAFTEIYYTKRCTLNSLLRIESLLLLQRKKLHVGRRV
jgi:hypothetical protein